MTKRPHIPGPKQLFIQHLLTRNIKNGSDELACCQIGATCFRDRAELQAANINPRTGLATDYLNHFNEAVMLLEMIPAYPESSRAA